MTTVELQKRSEKSQNLRVIQVDETWFYVESDEGKICYKVCYAAEDQYSCTCGDFARGIKNDQNFKCKHVLAVASCVPNGEQEKAQFLERRKPKLDERFITTIENKDFVLYAGLLDLAHQKGILKIDVDPIQLPTKENDHMAICRATVISKSGEVFTDVGDATPQNCHPRVAKHLLRMASTRAIARALRSMTNVGMTALEEIGDFGDIIDVKQEDRSTRKVAQAAPKKIARTEKKEVKPVSRKDKPGTPEVKQEQVSQANQDNGSNPPQAQAAPQPGGNGNGKGKDKKPAVPQMSTAQKNAIYNLSRRRGISVEELEKMSTDAYGVKVEHLTLADASSFIRQLQQSS
jgi:hypothetical protein